MRVLHSDDQRQEINSREVGLSLQSAGSPSVKNRYNKRPRIRSPVNYTPKQHMNLYPAEGAVGYEEEKEVKSQVNNSSKDEDVGLTMEQLEHIQLKMQRYCIQQNINMEYVFTDEEEQAGKDIAAFIETLDTIGLGLGVLEGFEMVGLLKLLDSNNDGVINVAQFISFLTMESENVVEENNVSYSTKRANAACDENNSRGRSFTTTC